MRKLTNREKITLSIGVLAAVGVVVYFFLWPMLMGKQAKSASGLKAKQERLELVEKLKAMELMASELEKSMGSQLGYNEIKFTRGIAGSIIMGHLAQVASRSEIGEVEQLDAKPEKSKKTQVSPKDDLSTLKSIVDQLYLCQIADEKKHLNEPKVETNPSMSAQPAKPANPDSTNKDKKQTESDKQTGADKTMFPLIPEDIPSEVKQSLVKLVEEHQGRTIMDKDMDGLLSEIKDEQETKRIKKRLALYEGRVKEKKIEVQELLKKLGIVQDVKTEGKLGRFIVKMVFKSEAAQLGRFLGNLQSSAKWLKIESMQISVADRQRTLLAVELSMTATVLYD